MIDNELLRVLYGGVTTIPDFNYDTLTAPPLNQILWHPNDIADLRNIATSIRYAGNIKAKYNFIDEIMQRRSMVRLAAGTNRLVYRHLEIPSIVVKIAVDSEGIKNNPDEFRNQFLIKPFCTKVFEVSQCGVAGIFERVDRITSRYEFATIADDVYDLIVNVLLGKYVLEDIGTNFMYNYGIRVGFGPVLLDFPYIYELDGAKLYCDHILDDRTVCGGEIDYDHGFNFLECTKCGRLFRASDLAKPRKESGIFMQANKKGALDMIVEICRGDEVIKRKEFKDTTQFMKTKKDLTKQRREKSHSNIPIAVGVYGKKTYKEALDEYNKKFGTNLEEYEEDKIRTTGIYEREYISEDSETDMEAAIRNASIPSGIVTETSIDIVSERCYGDDPVSESVIDNNDSLEEEYSVESTNDDQDTEKEQESVSYDIENDAVVDTIQNDNESNEISIDKEEPELEIVSTISFGDDDPAMQESTKTETNTIKPSLSRQRSKRYECAFYGMGNNK